MKLVSWNVNVIRAVINKGEFAKFIEQYDPDVICLQETKAKQNQAEIDLAAYEEFWNSADKAGYSGTAIFSKVNRERVLAMYTVSTPSSRRVRSVVPISSSL